MVESNFGFRYIPIFSCVFVFYIFKTSARDKMFIVMMKNYIYRYFFLRIDYIVSIIMIIRCCSVQFKSTNEYWSFQMLLDMKMHMGCQFDARVNNFYTIIEQCTYVQ